MFVFSHLLYNTYQLFCYIPGKGYFQLHSISTLPNVVFNVLYIVVGLLHSWVLASASGELQGMGMHGLLLLLCWCWAAAAGRTDL